MHMCVYIYIYIEREREGERYISLSLSLSMYDVDQITHHAIVAATRLDADTRGPSKWRRDMLKAQTWLE